MVFCKDSSRKTSTASFFSSINEVPNDVWESIACANSHYFQKNYLSAIAKNHPQIQFSYIVLYDELKTPVAFSAIKILDFEIKSVQNEELFSLDKLKKISNRLGIFSSKKPFKILVCGNIFVSGEHGIYIKENQDKQKIIQELAKSIVRFVDEDPQLKKEVKAFMLKDFRESSLTISDELYDSSYYSFNVEPNMLMAIDEDWNDFSGYLAAMKTKFRVKAKKALTLSEKLNVVTIDAENIDFYLEEMTSLYKSVSSKANFNLASFNIKTLKDLKLNLKDDFIIKAYFLNEELVGFLSGMVNQSSLDAHFVGLEYTKNKSHAIYQRILYDYIKIAIDHKLSYINFGRTASEIKSSVGAVPEKLTIYLRHRSSIPNKFLSLFLNHIKPTSFAQKFPFKNKELI